MQTLGIIGLILGILGLIGYIFVKIVGWMEDNGYLEMKEENPDEEKQCDLIIYNKKEYADTAIFDFSLVERANIGVLLTYISELENEGLYVMENQTFKIKGGKVSWDYLKPH